MAIRIGIVHDDVQTMQNLKNVIQRHQPFLTQDFACTSMRQVERENIFEDHNPHILFLDMDMHDNSEAGLEIIHRYHNSNKPKPKIIVVSQWCDSWMVRIMQRKKEKGFPVMGCITADNLFDEGVLPNLVMLVQEENQFVTDEDKRIVTPIEVPPPPLRLTERQRNILTLIHEGNSQREIALLFNRTEGGIYATIHQLKRRFNVRSLAQLVAVTRYIIYDITLENA